MKFSIKDFFNKCDQTCRKLRIWSHFLKKFVMKNFILDAVEQGILIKKKGRATYSENTWPKSVIKPFMSLTTFYAPWKPFRRYKKWLVAWNGFKYLINVLKIYNGNCPKNGQIHFKNLAAFAIITFFTAL